MWIFAEFSCIVVAFRDHVKHWTTFKRYRKMLYELRMQIFCLNCFPEILIRLLCTDLRPLSGSYEVSAELWQLVTGQSGP
jgi:hypothetical protein